MSSFTQRCNCGIATPFLLRGDRNLLSRRFKGKEQRIQQTKRPLKFWAFKGKLSIRANSKNLLSRFERDVCC